MLLVSTTLTFIFINFVIGYGIYPTVLFLLFSGILPWWNQELILLGANGYTLGVLFILGTSVFSGILGLPFELY